MFTAKGLFKTIPCPTGDQCRLPNCMFLHEDPWKSVKENESTEPQSRAASTPSDSFQETGDRKRRKLEDGKKAAVPSEGPRPSETSERKPFTGLIAPKVNTTSKPTAVRPVVLSSVRRAVSPPAVAPRNKLQAVQQTSSQPKKEVTETLNPRLVPNDPAGHAVRRTYLVKLHELVGLLNTQMLKSDDPEDKALYLSDQQLIKAVLDEEEGIARNNGPVYANIIKLRMVAYKKMKSEEWKKLRLEACETKEQKAAKKRKGVTIETGLSAAEELLMLKRFVAPKEGLQNFGYVMSPPTKEEIESAKKGVEASDHWELCDRCSTRFQVFPDRREDGALTSGGTCTHHWGRPFRNRKDKTSVYTCCSEAIGSPGCTTRETHVFKISEGKRLATILPFIDTPMNPTAQSHSAVAFDCEMGYTSYGLELIRLTATWWPSGEPLLDVLVRPLGAILDLNSRFSGVWPEQFFNAQEFESKGPQYPFPKSTPEGKEKGVKNPNPSSELRIVSDPAAARSLLLSHITTTTPLIGHAMENDLNAIRLVHPTIVDTILLFPHPQGLPLRFGLKNLVKQYLERDIQTAGAAGHDSLEDARATGDLVRWKVGMDWKRLQGDGWTVRNGEFFAPLPSQDSIPEKAQLPAHNMENVIRSEQAKKNRKRPKDEVTPEREVA
ncbi:hypothetical protein M501DRAFT_865848 [Patellaria atrata CBS 101060]|uniref:Exonuclease domain-containing protein n=1 Tax=Patellaria atrata CBS 101060 TaxID=1346257 RepID=A0A9P4VQX0_9PEZI|nr:hypothetical protein M501DRAFT_865848 [Patellaria atrata CBS 101060]